MVKINTRSSRTSSASASTQTNGQHALTAKHGQSKKAGRKRTAKKISTRIDAMKPKKPPTAFFYFLEDFRKEYQEMNPDVKAMRHVCAWRTDIIGKAGGDKWRTMTYEEKVKYYDIATEKRAEFDSAMANFNKRLESGEFDYLELDEEDSEFDG